MTTVDLPARASDTTAEAPWPLRVLATNLATYLDKAPSLWVEGQLVEVKRRTGSRTAFATLRDTDADISMTAVVDVAMLDRAGRSVSDGARVVVLVQPTFYAKRGTLTLAVRQIRAVGVGELLLRIEQLKISLAAEGLFDAAAKRPLPFLPTCIGLVCGRGSAAEHDVVSNARERWPAVRFEIREVAVQGETAVTAVSAALAELDGLHDVDVIVVARGGGSMEDLLPFSSETLIRAVASCRTPVVSAIGHEVDSPLLDLVADVRASTPTDAARRIVPDVADELARIRAGRDRARSALRRQLDMRARQLHDLRSRPVLGDPRGRLVGLIDVTRENRHRLAATLKRRCRTDQTQVGHVVSHLRSLAPVATLARGYAIVRTTDGAHDPHAASAGDVVRDPAQAAPGATLAVTVARGTFLTRRLDPDESAP